MSMPDINERLRVFERFSGKEVRIVISETLPDQSHAQKMFSSRRAMLGLLDRDITPAFFDALRAKVEYEYSYLLGIIESNTKLAETKKRLNKVLKTEYFVRKPLDTNIF